MGQPSRSRSVSVVLSPVPTKPMPVLNSMFRDIKPFRVLLLLTVVTAFAVAVPVEAQTVGIMTPLYRALPGVFNE